MGKDSFRWNADGGKNGERNSAAASEIKGRTNTSFGWPFRQ